MRRSVFTFLASGLCLLSLLADAAEFNPVRRAPVSIGPQAHRLVVGFRATAANTVVHTVVNRAHPEGVRIEQAGTTAADAAALAQRTGLAVARTRQVTPSMHVLFLQNTLYGIDVENALATLRADPSVRFAAVDERRYPLAGGAPVTPNDPLFKPTPGTASGQWYLLAPNANAVVEGTPTMDLSATDAVDAWAITTGSKGVVIADVDTGITFDHPDLLRAGVDGSGNPTGRLLPGYDFVGEDYDTDPKNGAPLGTYLVANDGDGWDADPTDPGDWISQSDFAVKDRFGNNLFAASSCGELDPNSNTYVPVNSSWHGTRVVGIFGALANNGAGIAGMSWNSWVLPVRALGKCGGYDSDIIAAIQWAAGMAVTPPDAKTSSVTSVPLNPYPADIINLSLGGGTTCPQSYQTALPDVVKLGVLIVAAAGNASGPTAAPANCSPSVSGLIAVAGLRNVGTKVGYSSFGPEVGVSAPAGNCVIAGNCLRSIDTTTNTGTTGPIAGSSGASYTNEAGPNLGTSFSAPIVSGIAALMRSVNANLTPAQLVTRLETSATPFPPAPTGLPVCPDSDATSGECACPQATINNLANNGQCGTGMVNALSAVKAALQPIAVVTFPATLPNPAMLDASKSVAACGYTIASYQWATATSGLIKAGATSSTVTVDPTIGGTLTLTVTDNAGHVDVQSITVAGTNVTDSTAPKSAGTAATACPTPIDPTPAAPTVAAAFSPATVGENSNSTLTITFTNPNGFDLTQSNFSYTLPAGLTIPTSPKGGTTCFGSAENLSNTTTGVTLTNGIIPAKSSCNITVPVTSATTASYTATIAAAALSTGPAGANTAAASASLTVNVPSASKGGGGALGWPELLLTAGLVAGIRRRAALRAVHRH